MQKLLSNYKNLDCQALTDYAFNTHVECYLSKNNALNANFCNLTLKDYDAFTKTLQISDIIKEPIKSFTQVKIANSLKRFKFHVNNNKIIYYILNLSFGKFL